MQNVYQIYALATTQKTELEATLKLQGMPMTKHGEERSSVHIGANTISLHPIQLTMTDVQKQFDKQGLGAY